MSITKNISAEELAKLFYGYRDTLAPDFGFQGSEGCISWEQTLPEHRNLMVASARLVLQELAQGQCAAGSRQIGLRESA